MAEFQVLAEKKFDTELPCTEGLPGQWYILSYKRITNKKGTELAIELKR